MRAQITFRSGAQIVVDVDSVKVGTGNLSGEIQSLTWETPADWTTKLLDVDLPEIVAVVCLRDPAVTSGATDAG